VDFGSEELIGTIGSSVSGEAKMLALPEKQVFHRRRDFQLQINGAELPGCRCNSAKVTDHGVESLHLDRLRQNRGPDIPGRA
jgi:hypothetical protein